MAPLLLDGGFRPLAAESSRSRARESRCSISRRVPSARARAPARGLWTARPRAPEAVRVPEAGPASHRAAGGRRAPIGRARGREAFVGDAPLGGADPLVELVAKPREACDRRSSFVTASSRASSARFARSRRAPRARRARPLGDGGKPRRPHARSRRARSAASRSAPDDEARRARAPRQPGGRLCVAHRVAISSASRAAEHRRHAPARRASPAPPRDRRSRRRAAPTRCRGAPCLRVHARSAVAKPSPQLRRSPWLREPFAGGARSHQPYRDRARPEGRSARRSCRRRAPWRPAEARRRRPRRGTPEPGRHAPAARGLGQLPEPGALRLRTASPSRHNARPSGSGARAEPVGGRERQERSAGLARGDLGRSAPRGARRSVRG